MIVDYHPNDNEAIHYPPQVEPSSSRTLIFDTKDFRRKLSSDLAEEGADRKQSSEVSKTTSEDIDTFLKEGATRLKMGTQSRR